jgi:LPPG:FO 2-phospho-L-lactate transferase
VIAGGTGGAKLAAGFDAVLPAGDLTVIANTADDDEFWGLLVCPDVDAVIYRLAGVFNESAGYGQKDETFHALDALRAMGEETWFRVGDKDLAMHVLRAEMLRRGATLTEASLDLCRRFGLRSAVVPMSDDPVRTRFVTDRGTLSLQEYFVRERLEPALRAIDFEGLQSAQLSSSASAALDEAGLVVIGPSNPLISIDPVLDVIGGRMRRDATIAVSPIVGGRALKGPTVEMMRAMDLDPSPVEVARRYRDRCSGFVLDTHDSQLREQIETMDYRVLECDTVMDDGGARLARDILRWAK